MHCTEGYGLDCPSNDEEDSCHCLKHQDTGWQTNFKSEWMCKVQSAAQRMDVCTARTERDAQRRQHTVDLRLHDYLPPLLSLPLQHHLL